MTQEEKDLLIKDLAPRVPFGVMVEQTLFPINLADKEQRLKSVQPNYCVQLYWYKYIDEFVPIHCVKPYLRPMSSMTKEERKEYNDIVKNTIDFYDCQKSEEICLFIIPIDWLNSHHFDYRGLIEKGLALEAPEDMYK